MRSRKFFFFFQFISTFSIIIFNMVLLPDRRYFQYVPFHWHVKLREIHSDFDNVRADLLVHVPQVYLQNESFAFFIGSGEEIIIKKNQMRKKEKKNYAGRQKSYGQWASV